MDGLIDSEEYNGYKILTYYDDCAESPRDWDNLGRMVLSHKRYDFPNEAGIDFGDFESWQEVIDHLKKEYNARVILPVQMYEHSLIRLYVGNTHDRWDGGQAGLIFATAADIRKWYDVKKITAGIIDKTTQALRAEVETYSAYVNGECYRFTVEDEDGEELDSCGGYLGEDGMEAAIEEAKSYIDWYVKQPKPRVVAKKAQELHA